MKKDKADLKQILKNSIFGQGQFYVKLSFTFLFAVIFVVSFFALDGYKYFYTNVYADNFEGYNFQIHSIDVEQGDCFLIKFSNNQCMLIDSGKEMYADSVCEYIRQFFIEENIEKIDYFLLTHPDSDHIGGAKTILKTFKVKTLLRPPIYSYSESKDVAQNFDVDETLTYDQAIMYAYEKDIQMQIFQQGMELTIGGCKVEFLSPKLERYSSSNNYSAVVMFTEQTKKFLFMGDAEEEVERSLIKEYGQKLKADVLKIGHHGSITSSSQEFLNLVSPSYAILSCGKSYYFPSNVVLSRLNEIGAKVVTTADSGNFVFSIKNTDIVYAKASRPANFSALTLCVVLLLSFIVWENPFKKYNTLFLQKKPLN